MLKVQILPFRSESNLAAQALIGFPWMNSGTTVEIVYKIEIVADIVTDIKYKKKVKSCVHNLRVRFLPSKQAKKFIVGSSPSARSKT